MKQTYYSNPNAADSKITLTDYTDDVLSAMSKAVERALTEIGETAEGNAKTNVVENMQKHAVNTPRTGRLLGSITYRVQMRGSEYAAAYSVAYDDSGQLQIDSVGTERVEGDSVIIGTNVEYAIFYEYGTGIYASNGNGRKSPWAYKDYNGAWHWTEGMKPSHFLRDAIQNHIDEYRNIITENLRNA